MGNGGAVERDMAELLGAQPAGEVVFAGEQGIVRRFALVPIVKYCRVKGKQIARCIVSAMGEKTSDGLKPLPL